MSKVTLVFGADPVNDPRVEVETLPGAVALRLFYKNTDGSLGHTDAVLPPNGAESLELALRQCRKEIEQ